MHFTCMYEGLHIKILSYTGFIGTLNAMNYILNISLDYISLP